MIPIMDEDNGFSEEKSKIVVKCFGENGRYLFYDDDGITFDFEKGVYSLTELTFERSEGKINGNARTVYEQYASAYEFIFAG